jgi:hypothetical protein
MELFYASSNVCMNLALQRNYAIMLSTSMAADDKNSRSKVYPAGKRPIKHHLQSISICRIIPD